MSVYFIQIECSAELYLFISLEVMCENYGSMVLATAIFHCISQGAILQAKMCEKSTNLYFELIWNANKFSHILVYLNFDAKWAALCIKDALTMHPHISFENIYVILNVLWVNSTENFYWSLSIFPVRFKSDHNDVTLNQGKPLGITTRDIGFHVHEIIGLVWR